MAIFLNASAFAETITEAKVEPSEVKAGESFKVIVKVSGSDSTGKVTRISSNSRFKSGHAILEFGECSNVAPELFECEIKVHPKAPSGNYTYTGGFYAYGASDNLTFMRLPTPLQVTG